MEEMNPQVYQQITDLIAEGEKYFDLDQFDSAIGKFNEALDLVPLPKNDWEVGNWLYATIGDAYFMLEKYQEAADSFYDAYNGNVKSPFINLRLGQCLYELGQFEKAEDFLMRAYMLDGTDIFEGDGEKYLAYMREKYDLD